MFVDSFSPTALYDVQSSLSNILTGFTTSDTTSPLLLPVCYSLGLVTSLSPCTLGLLPITLTYIKTTTPRRGAIETRVGGGGGMLAEEVVGTDEDETAGGVTVAFPPTSSLGRKASPADTILATLLYSIGLSLVFATTGVGLTAVSANLPSPTGLGLDYKSAVGGLVMVGMGGGVLDLWKVPLLGKAGGVGMPEETGAVEGYGWLGKPLVLGVTSGFVSSPCSTPVLTSLLAYLANSSSVVTPLLSLLSYTTGYVTLLVLASFKGMESLESIAGDEERNEGIMRVLGAGVVAVGGRMIMDGVLGDANLRGVGLL